MMSCFVSPLQAQVNRFYAKRLRMNSRLICDTHEELMNVGQILGLKLSWLQRPGMADEHFSLSEGRREMALMTGVNEATMLEMEKVIASKRKALHGQHTRGRDNDGV